MSDELVCIAPPGVFWDYDNLICRIPARNPDDVETLLECVATGGALGSGYRMQALGVELPRIREAYETKVADFVEEVARRKAAGMPSQELARWAVTERARIANSLRSEQGIGARVVYEVRDTIRYGRGGRTHTNMAARYARRGLSGEELDSALIQGAMHPNSGISSTAIRGARYLRYGGRVVLLISLATTAYVLLTAPEDQLAEVLFEETGSAIGGSIGTGLSVGLCIVFGVASGGWGLLACGAFGGLLGGLGGAYVGEHLYYTTDDAVSSALETGTVAMQLLSAQPPICY